MIKVEAPTLQEAYSKAARELSCSVIDLEINILQNGSGGFLGMFKKSAIIEVHRKGSKPVREERKEPQHVINKEKESIASTSVLSPTSGVEEKKNDRNRRNKNRRNKGKNKEGMKPEENSFPKSDTTSVRETREALKQEIKHEVPKMAPSAPREMRHSVSQNPVEKPFVVEKRNVDEVIDDVRFGVQNLFKYSCFTLNVPTVSAYNEDTILIEFSGEDAALLIGKEGYRYKALSYLLYNWINLKYGLNIRLEIAEFLKNQEEMIEKYLLPVMERIRTSGRGQTKILDGVLIKIALESLRKEFPEKYVGIKSGREGGKFIVVNDFNRKNP
jgi:spoIIIJ-associated protein